MCEKREDKEMFLIQIMKQINVKQHQIKCKMSRNERVITGVVDSDHIVWWWDKLSYCVFSILFTCVFDYPL